MQRILSFRPAFVAARPTRRAVVAISFSVSPPPNPTNTTTFSQYCRSFTMSQKPQEPTITRVSDLPTQDAKWVTLQKVEYVDQVGKPRVWEVASRKTRSKTGAGIDAVAMGNILLHPSKPPSTLIVIQYRPPHDAYTIEWPAGLIDANETPEEAAVREFKEETGYECKVLDISPVQAADPGLSSANMVMAMVEVNLKEGDEEPEQRLEDGEHIQRVVVPLSELYEKLVEYSKRERHIVAAKLFHFAAGMEFARNQKYGIWPEDDKK
ncbi:NUDIX hydrolase domain-like protein [Apodospora peruviana]|uniref:NUDIX hydrolase domain-like protein n=1 Tax=Apodospora peruviana TaxID=516989 RepID=A0AAE0ID71_9PEZI|nr:NUDIX hydrolase domain-like protein [Apodospora peruviana]